MKTTIDLPDDLYRQVKAKCALQGKKIRELTVELYRQWLVEDATGDDAASPERWLEDWVRMGEAVTSKAPSGPSATEILAADRAHLEGR